MGVSPEKVGYKIGQPVPESTIQPSPLFPLPPIAMG
jgi:hypothetical protein